jgi:TetR/AcrR family tetracycline transcriptional repressor
MHPHRSRGERAGLTRAVVLDGAFDLLTTHPVETLSLRALARHLGVAPNALYSHITDKSDLIEGLLDHALAAVQSPPARTPPADALAAIMTSTYDVLLAHPALVPHYLARQGSRGPNATHLGTSMLGFLARADVRGDAAGEALRVLIVYTIGFAALTTSSAAEPRAPLSQEELRGNFHNGLRWLLDGITAHRGSAST